ncbi:MAG: type II toxin-antitoxin system HicB family antitoxin [Desulfovibrio sp.]|nr:type II toxin-antitoxin system HicB family antitoxin [Desulfovibrio sp.]
MPCEQGYAVLFPDLPGCNSQGDTLPEAFSMAMEALAGHLEAMADDGETIPAPSGEAEATRKFKEQFAGLDGANARGGSAASCSRAGAGYGHCQGECFLRSIQA